MVEIKRNAMVLHSTYFCPACQRVMWIDTLNGAMWCLGNKQLEAPGTTECPQQGFKFEIPRMELTVKEYGNPQVAAT